MFWRLKLSDCVSQAECNCPLQKAMGSILKWNLPFPPSSLLFSSFFNVFEGVTIS